MISLRLDEIAAVVQGSVHGDASTTVTAVTTDSRQVAGDGATLFIALPGARADGQAFVADAVAAGAVAVLGRRPEPGVAAPTVVVADPWLALAALAAHVRAAIDPTSIAVTGSVGKTTVKDLTAAAVGAGLRAHASRGSFNNELGVPLTLLGMPPGTQALIAEVGARRVGDIARLAPLLEPDVAVVTAVAGVHLEVFGTIEDVARAKSELVEALRPGGTAVLNVGDPRVAAMAGAAPGVVTVATDLPAADVHALDVRLDPWARARATAVTPWGRTELSLPIAGRHQVVNALLALAVAGHLGVDLDAAATAIAEAPVSPWRSEVRVDAGVTVLNDAYNANPTSVVAALETLVAIERGGRAVAILGVMAEIGPTADEEHARVGRACATTGLDAVIVVGHEAQGIARGAREAGLAQVVEAADAAAAARIARGWVAKGDVVLVKGSRVAGLEGIADALIAGRVAS